MELGIGFNAERAAEDMVNWIKQYAKYTGMKGVVVGNSGGKDCAVVMAACVKALGRQNVLSLMLPNGEQKDIDYAYNTVEFLGIRSKVVNIEKLFNHILEEHKLITGREMKQEAMLNIAPKLRMTWITTIAQDMGYRVACTGNASEAYMGYFTKWGDMCGDFRPLMEYTCNEVILLGLALGLPEKAVLKTPEDGLTGVSDEEKMGVSYDDIHNVIRGTGDVERANLDKILTAHEKAKHKIIHGIPTCPFNYKYYEI